MRLTVIGCGYLGAVHAACMADFGHDVVGVDVDAARVKDLAAARAPFFEPGLPELLERATASGRLRFTTDVTDLDRPHGPAVPDDGPAVHVLETEGTVVLSASVVGGPDGEPCTAQLLAEDVTVELDRPLGDRIVLDAFTGLPVPCGEGHGTSPKWD